MKTPTQSIQEQTAEEILMSKLRDANARIRELESQLLQIQQKTEPDMYDYVLDMLSRDTPASSIGHARLLFTSRYLDTFTALSRMQACKALITFSTKHGFPPESHWSTYA